MSGDDEAMAQAERKAAKLVGAWLAWFKTQSVEALPGVRMDILVKRVGPAAAEVFTLELTELGFSMLGVNTLPPLVFGALLASCFEDTGPTPEEARRLTDGTEKLTAESITAAAAAAAPAAARASQHLEWTNGDAKPEAGSPSSHKEKRRRTDHGHADAADEPEPRHGGDAR